MKTLKKKEAKERIALELEVKLLERLRIFVKSENTTMRNVIEVSIEKFLDENERQLTLKFEEL